MQLNLSLIVAPKHVTSVSAGKQLRPAGRSQGPKLDGSSGHLKKLDFHWHKHFLHFADCSVNETCIYTVNMAARVTFAVRNLAALRPAPVSSMPSISQQARRQFQSSRTLLADATAPKKPVGAFRGS